MGREVVIVWISGSQIQPGITEEIVKWVLVVFFFMQIKMNAAQQRL